MTIRTEMQRQTADFWHAEIIHSEKWDANDDQSKHTPLSAAVFEKIMADFAQYGDNCPRILSIHSYERDFHFECKIDIQLLGGIVMEVDSQFTGNTPVPKTLAKASDEVAELVSDLVGNCAEIGFKELSDKFDNARSGINKLLEQWSNDGDAQIDLLDLRISSKPYWQPVFDTSVQITVSCLGEALLPEKMHVQACCPEEAVAEVMELHEEIKTRTEAKARLESHGADGFIDLTALNSLLVGGSVKARSEDYLPRLRDPDLHRDFGVKCGRLYLEATDSSDARVNWCDGYIDIFDGEIPSTMHDSLPGKPITDLIEHPFLTSEIIIKDLQKFWYGEDYLRITFEQPCFYYSRKTGRFWAVREPDGSHNLYR